VSNRPSRSTSHSARVSQASKAGKGGSPVLWIVLAVVIVVAGVVAIGVSRSSESAEGGGESPSGGTVVPSGDIDFGTVSTEGVALPGAGAGGTDGAVSEPLPTVEGEMFDGTPMTITPAGKPMIVLGLAHWCGHCRAEVPRLQEWFDANGMPDDVDVVAVATASSSSQPNFPPGEWLVDEGWSVPTLVDDEAGTAGTALGVQGFPAFIVVDADGNVVQRASGELTIEQWEQLMEAARTGTAAA
jgi:cytochrome c biogenesis protein CcmG, thiol:disulfide interchange protein DsbE